VRRFLLVCAVGLVAAWVVGYFVLWQDDENLPNDANAVIVLSGSDESLPAGRALVGGGISDTLVVATERNSDDEQRAALCRNAPEDVVCIVRGPFATGGELQALAKYARAQEWDTVVAVAPSYMGLRLDRVFDRCGGTRVVLAAVDEPWWRDAIALPLEWVKLGVAETVRRTC